MKKLVVLRHGESIWNLENRFTGWTDVGLTEKGILEAKRAAKFLEEFIQGENHEFDLLYTSVLKRAIHTAQITLAELDLDWLPVERSWRLNERHYGALQGLNKIETVEKHGEAQVKIWRRSYDTPPPSLPEGDKRLPDFDRRYKDLKKEELPRSESLKTTVDRLMPYLHHSLLPSLKSGKKPIVFAHGNSIRAMLKALFEIPNDEIVEMNIPTAIPMLLEFSDSMEPQSFRYLADENLVQAELEKVKNQTKK